MAIQHRVGILPERRFGSYFANHVACYFAALEIDTPASPGGHALLVITLYDAVVSACG
jgi:hypothetical protein